MANLRSIDMLVLDDIFEMHGGYVLNFSDRTFARFFTDELGLDIYDPKYARDGTSKARRLRCFVQTAEASIVTRALNALWEYREAVRAREGQDEKVRDALGQFKVVTARLSRKPSASASERPQAPLLSDTFRQLREDFKALLKLDSQPRGYAFEGFLKASFDKFGLEARDPFRIRGEQIDGSFVLASEVYLLEAKWRNSPADAADLRAFHGKIEEKAAWTRGLFVSFSGFSDDGIAAFGKGKRIVCMDGLDISEALTRELPFDRVIDRKVRSAGETGSAFVRVRDLFPI